MIISLTVVLNMILESCRNYFDILEWAWIQDLGGRISIEVNFETGICLSYRRNLNIGIMSTHPLHSHYFVSFYLMQIHSCVRQGIIINTYLT